MSKKPILGITMGDPAGVGPEITLKAWLKEEIFEMCRPIFIGDAKVLQMAAKGCQLSPTIKPISGVRSAAFERGTLEVLETQNVDLNKLEVGKISALAGQAAFESIHKAIALALANEIDGIVTNPIHKEAINLAGHHFAGHTEILAHYTNTPDVGLMLAYGNFRVIHVSTHVSLRKACDLVKKDRILKVMHMLNDACMQMGIVEPRLGVAALNPHASDGGLFGHEEAEEILPAVNSAKAAGLRAEGPVPSDTLFAKARAGFYDGVVVMYHDQGHIPFKLQTFTFDDQRHLETIHGVNITLGLPIIRTSVVHGTAFDIAGKGIASPDTLVEAIQYAAKLAARGKP